MVDSDKIKNSLIDEFYNEEQGKVDKNAEYSDEYRDFKSVLNSAGEKMDVLNDDIFDFDIDTLSIIEQGEFIRENRKVKKEFIFFVLLSTIILSLYAIAIIILGSKILIISQMIIASIAPWIIIPVLVIKRKRSEA
ncbi:hypothetical protein LGL55_12395 [Clostridium tagluense]|uniref:hypothetical protein n=1 Tax=Clostridium tagluense TaxID=360422 RepID=UPI001CF1BF79|nr:hypothetical protein [Clostridium tagluense]MCB2312232.1 hypothetical protein [Clostridium tagluense]MCB2316819.1 hypothetical protein [Clostridium tagluense]MCB2321680.1 hypothetical protein [Clostridium tagluense]MCB2326688.1 hypothetical protein [Clostridium tagluense]MCB2331411.1 hypothetical protein [Clostridium tagluense]